MYQGKIRAIRVPPSYRMTLSRKLPRNLFLLVILPHGMQGIQTLNFQSK